MGRLGYTEFVAQGGDWGAAVTQAMAAQAPQGCWGSTPTWLAPPRAGQGLCHRRPPTGGPHRRGADRLPAAGPLLRHPPGRRPDHGHPPPDPVRAGRLPVELAAFMLDHGDGTGQPGLVTQVLDGTLEGELTRDDLLDTITLYWLTNTGISAARLYGENTAGFFDAKPITIPFAISVFPDELDQAPAAGPSAPTDQPAPLPAARPRRPLRRLGTTPAPRPGTPDRLPTPPLSPRERPCPPPPPPLLAPPPTSSAWSMWPPSPLTTTSAWARSRPAPPTASCRPPNSNAPIQPARAGRPRPSSWSIRPGSTRSWPPTSPRAGRGAGRHPAPRRRRGVQRTVRTTSLEIVAIVGGGGHRRQGRRHRRRPLHGQRAGADIIEVEGSHLIMVSQPQAVVDVVVKATQAVSSSDR
jgi:hypothetical protein